jgi:S1-C subfamily serine protease
VGTGLILEEGHILTNNHVVADGQRIIVTLSNGDSFEAELVVGAKLPPTPPSFFRK